MMFAISQGLHRSAHLRGFGRDVEKGTCHPERQSLVRVLQIQTFTSENDRLFSFKLVLLFITGLSNLEHGNSDSESEHELNSVLTWKGSLMSPTGKTETIQHIPSPNFCYLRGGRCVIDTVLYRTVSSDTLSDSRNYYNIPASASVLF